MRIFLGNVHQRTRRSAAIFSCGRNSGNIVYCLASNYVGGDDYGAGAQPGYGRQAGAYYPPAATTTSCPRQKSQRLETATL
jgi:hypothetical protein